MINSKRIEAVRKELAAQGADAVLLGSPQNKFYLGGLFSSSGYLLVTPGRTYALTDGRYFAELKGENKFDEVLLLDAVNTFSVVAKRIIQAEKVSVLGFESQTATYVFYQMLAQSLPCRLQALELNKLRCIKDKAEIAKLKEACRIAEKAFQHMLSYIKSGMSEQKVANELVRFMRECGAEKEAFDSIVASGLRGALPHGKASEKIIRRGELITLDFGARYRQYCSDMTRTIAIGFCDERLKHVYDAVRAARDAALKMTGPGRSLGEVDLAAREVIRNRGYGDYFTHNLGHGIGLEVHEYPAVAPDGKDLLLEGMVITIEPGIYIPGLGGVRIEEDVLLTSTGCEILTNPATELRVIKDV